MTPLSWLILAAVSLVFSALFSGVEIAYITSDRVMTGLDIHKGGLLSRLVDRFYRSQELFISTILVGNNIMLVVYGMGAAAILEPWLRTISPNEAFVLAMSTLISTLVILFTGEFIPKTIFRINPNASLRFFAVPVFLFYIILYPIAWLTARLSRLLMRLAGVHTSSETLGLLTVGDLNRLIEKTIDEAEETPGAGEVETEVKMFHNALDFRETELRECMLPRNEIVAVDIDTTSREQLSRLFTSSGRSKIIVYRTDIDNILGYIHVSELFDTSVDWKERIKEVVYAPETLLAAKMMRRLLQEKRSMAVVVDEFGGTAGLVTLEDLVEEIFGDIRDEHDGQAPVATEVSPGVYDFSGRMEVRDINEEFRLDIPESDEYQTLAGYLLNITGQLPPQGAVIEADPYLFTIRRRTATRLELIRVETNPSSTDN